MLKLERARRGKNAGLTDTSRPAIHGLRLAAAGEAAGVTSTVTVGLGCGRVEAREAHAGSRFEAGAEGLRRRHVQIACQYALNYYIVVWAAVAKYWVVQESVESRQRESNMAYINLRKLPCLQAHAYARQLREISIWH